MNKKNKIKEPHCFELVMWERDHNGNPIRQISTSSHKGCDLARFFDRNKVLKRKKKTKAATKSEAEQIVKDMQDE